MPANFVKHTEHEMRKDFFNAAINIKIIYKSNNQ